MTALSGCVTRERASDILEVDVTNTPERVNGQPVLAVNPTDPRNLVLIAANHLPRPDIPTVSFPDRALGGDSIAEFDCLAAFSRDGGMTWSTSTFPKGERPFCGDPYLAVDSSGRFFTVFNQLGCPGRPTIDRATPCPQGGGMLAAAWSVDGGRTWSNPVATPAGVSVTPRLRIDRAGDHVYAVGSKGGASTMAVTVSTDHGLTWSMPAELPAQPFGNQIAVHDGLLATATALAIDGGKVKATEVKFWVSADHGATFTAHTVTDSRGIPVAPPTGAVVPDNQTLKSTDPVPFVSADPTGRGRFALMIPRDGTLEVYVTPDAGRSWSGPAVIAAPGAAKPWIDYGSNGLLGVMWRTLRDDKVDVYSTVSFDGGKTFGSPLKANQTTYRYGFPGTGGDEWSRILIDGEHAFVTWADGRGGGALDAVMARIPLTLYRHPAR